jgi:hypothetical protein
MAPDRDTKALVVQDMVLNKVEHNRINLTSCERGKRPKNLASVGRKKEICQPLNIL